MPGGAAVKCHLGSCPSSQEGPEWTSWWTSCWTPRWTPWWPQSAPCWERPCWPWRGWAQEPCWTSWSTEKKWRAPARRPSWRTRWRQGWNVRWAQVAGRHRLEWWAGNFLSKSWIRYFHKGHESHSFRDRRYLFTWLACRVCRDHAGTSLTPRPQLQVMFSLALARPSWAVGVEEQQAGQIQKMMDALVALPLASFSDRDEKGPFCGRPSAFRAIFGYVCSRQGRRYDWLGFIFGRAFSLLGIFGNFTVIWVGRSGFVGGSRRPLRRKMAGEDQRRFFVWNLVGRLVEC